MMSRRQALVAVNAISLSRLPLVLAFVGFAVWHGGAGRGGAVPAGTALGLLVLASLTDLFDGVLARRWGATSRLGALLDPLMDKVFYLSVFPTLVYLLARAGEAERPHAVLMLVFTVACLLRDQWVSFLRAAAAGTPADVRANWIGKLRTAVSFPIGCAVYVYAAFAPWWLPRPWLYGAEVFGLALTLSSIHVYTRRFLPCLKRTIEAPP
jgi:CDP-diacylglycerol--glycerol-3-phosphate 3-phosphatidyltransferase